MICTAIDDRGNKCVRDDEHDGRSEGQHHQRRGPAHPCHAIGCDVEVPPKMLMCLKHWRMVPRDKQAAIWNTYRPGQEVDKHPTEAYMEAQSAAVEAVREGELKRGAIV